MIQAGNGWIKGLVWMWIWGILACAGTAIAVASADVPMKLDDVVVSGEKISAFSRANPHQAVSLERAEILKRNYLDVYEAISGMPGIDVKPLSTGLGSRITIRGGGGSGPVLVLIDGRPANTSQYGGVDLAGIPMDAIRRITVFKPPVPVWLGPGGAAGAVYIETNRGKTGPARNHEGKVSVYGGSYGLARLNGSVKTGSGAHHTLVSGGCGHRDGKRTNSDKTDGNLMVNWDVKTDHATQCQVNGKYIYAEHGSAGPTYNPTLHARQRYEKGSLDTKVKGGMGDVADYDVKAYGDMESVRDRTESGAVYTLDVYRVGTAGEVVWSELLKTHDVRLGGSMERIYADHPLTGDHHRNSVSAHVEHTWRIYQAILSTGVRGDYSTDFHFSPAGNLGLVFGLTDTTHLDMSVGYTENLPSFGQLYQSSHGSFDQVRGNPDLKEEKIVSTTMGIEKIFSKERVFSVSLFRTDTRNRIQYERGEDLITRPFNIDTAFKQGVEVSLKYRVAAFFVLEASYLFQETEATSTHKELTYSPEHQGKVSFKVSLPVDTRVETSLRAYTRQFTDAANTSSEIIDGYANVDVKVIQPMTVWRKKVEGFVHLTNVFDKKFESHFGYPDDGFRFTAGINMNL